jgi:hypothetical protein
LGYVTFLIVKKLRTRFVRVASLGRQDWGVLAEAIVTLLAIQIALHVVDFPRLLSWTRRTSRGTPLPAHLVRHVAWLVSIAGRLTPCRCLARSLALSRVLGRRGVATEVRIGVLTDGGTLQAHAWVEWTGRLLNDHPGNLQRFAPFDRSIEIANV